MEKSKVYFTDMHCSFNHGQLDKLKKLVLAAGLYDIDFDRKFTAIKIHFGEPGNMAFLRPNYSRVIVDLVRARGGKPFLTDCNTLYVGGRKNALDHLDSAYANGYNPFQTGCHTIIADGLKGTDEAEVPVTGGTYVKSAKIGQAIMDADVFISMNHFKGHENTGFGGAMKNIGMGCGSRAGKMEMHSSGKPHVRKKKCVGCMTCTKICAHDAISITDKLASIDHDRCVGCGRCIGVCPMDAIAPDWNQANDVLNCKIAEYSQAVLAGRPHFHVSLVIDVSPFCDCHAENDMAIVPNVGMFASFDPVALDQACADAVNAQPVLHGSLADCDHEGHDHFHAVSPNTDWEVCLDHAEKLGIGTRQYELITVE